MERPKKQSFIDNANSQVYANFEYSRKQDEYIDHLESKLKNHGVIGDVSERVQRIAVYFADKNPTPTKWVNDILKYILEGSKHAR